MVLPDVDTIDVSAVDTSLINSQIDHPISCVDVPGHLPDAKRRAESGKIRHQRVVLPVLATGIDSAGLEIR